MKGTYTHHTGIIYKVICLVPVSPTYTEAIEEFEPNSMTPAPNDIVIFHRADHFQNKHYAIPLSEFETEAIWPDGKVRAQFIRGRHNEITDQF